ncbi:uncharacterized protein ACA1_062650 [Acanthamoeba castellanii str. Neff]|uniref:Uncharacterized protein n=1 Tax=Acanthamoeba castellanii (strain ATCC 30010 / Neff) TaxID=1257118 RepID=L8GZI9_ACACF|nr:uncharacterized protein ACA1_062650 [Acanthamoeba castellanii str. Neff]ELR17521.1 hypothetical protein ACA1_062650 [Acanthamoeba castellanii str. Neff]
MLRRELFPHEGRQDAPSSVSYEAVVELAPGEPSDDEQLEREFLESAPPMDELQWGEVLQLRQLVEKHGIPFEPVEKALQAKSLPVSQHALVQLTEEDLKKQKDLKMKPRKQLLNLINTLQEDESAQFDLATFLHACLHDMEDCYDLATATQATLLDAEIVKFDDLMMLNMGDLAELNLNPKVTERLGIMIQIFSGSHLTEMERLHAALAKMIEDRQGDQITPELWQHCEESARLYAFVDRMLHGCPLPGVDATRIRRISNSLTYFVDRKHLFSFNENNWERQQQAEQEHEIISLSGDGVFRTSPYTATLQTSLQQCALDDSFTVTFVGSTHAGKSFVIRELMNIRNPLKPPTIGRPAYLEKEGGGTSLNACCYFERLKDTVLQDQICKFVDMEGYNAAGGRARRHGAAAAVAAAQDLFTKKREESVEQQLPRLAYLLSDVIIFVDVVDAANKDYFDRVYQFAFSAVDRIASAPKPSLIILQNKCGQSSQLNVDLATERFWNEHDPHRTLSNVYQDLRWVSVPDFTDPNFFPQMQKLREELATMLNAQKERRVVKLTNELWRAMQHYVVDNFGSNHFSVGAFLAQHFKSGSPMADHVFSRFMRQYERHSALNYPAKRSPQFKKFCVEAVHFLAALWVWTNKTEENGEPRLPPIEGTTDTAEAQRKDRLTKTHDKSIALKADWILDNLLSSLQKSWPCDALCDFGTNSGEGDIYCTQTLLSGHTAHRSPLKVDIITQGGWWLRFKSFFTRGVPAVWPGEYLKAKVGITHERLCEEFHVALFSFQQMGVVDLLDCLHRFVDLQPTSASNCALCGRLLDISMKCFFCNQPFTRLFRYHLFTREYVRASIKKNDTQKYNVRFLSPVFEPYHRQSDQFEIQRAANLVYCLKQHDLTVIAEIQIPKNNTVIVHLSEELQYRLGSQLNEGRLFTRTAAYIEYRHPISLHLWAALMHYQATEDRLDDIIVDQISSKYDGQELSSTIIACLFLYRLTSHLWDLYEEADEEKKGPAGWDIAGGLKTHLEWVLDMAGMFLFPRKKSGGDDAATPALSIFSRLLTQAPTLKFVATVISDIVAWDAFRDLNECGPSFCLALLFRFLLTQNLKDQKREAALPTVDEWFHNRVAFLRRLHSPATATAVGAQMTSLSLSSGSSPVPSPSSSFGALPPFRMSVPTAIPNTPSPTPSRSTPTSPRGHSSHGHGMPSSLATAHSYYAPSASSPYPIYFASSSGSVPTRPGFASPFKAPPPSPSTSLGSSGSSSSSTPGSSYSSLPSTPSSSSEMMAVPAVDLKLWILVTDWIARSLCTKTWYQYIGLIGAVEWVYSTLPNAEIAQMVERIHEQASKEAMLSTTSPIALCQDQWRILKSVVIDKYLAARSASHARRRAAAGGEGEKQTNSGVSGSSAAASNKDPSATPTTHPRDSSDDEGEFFGKLY